MSENMLRGKILFFDDDPTHIQPLKTFFEENNLTGWKVRTFSTIVEVVKSNVDVGMLLLSPIGIEQEVFYATLTLIHNLRPELPIIVYENGADTLDAINTKTRNAVSAFYSGNDTGELKQLVETHLFSIFFPEALIRGIEEISEETLKMLFQDVEVFTCAPYLIKDSVIFGELLSMIPLESNWCRGSMLLQVEKEKLSSLIRNERTPFPANDTSSTILNNLLGEVTNMIWGRFKSKFFTHDHDYSQMLSQVPIIVDQESKYISFGSKNPQLCFRYVIHDAKDEFEPISIYQRFVFHLHWAPEEFKEPEAIDIDSILAGEIDFF
ncbi:MAG: chemotaxis protein CheX [SAR324 cluster bacterium]|nr:chemotaxis protein CheX [SAR324 cluster bacterium]